MTAIALLQTLQFIHTFSEVPRIQYINPEETWTVLIVSYIFYNVLHFL